MIRSTESLNRDNKTTRESIDEQSYNLMKVIINLDLISQFEVHRLGLRLQKFSIEVIRNMSQYVVQWR
jgi:hypothetical protein